MSYEPTEAEKDEMMVQAPCDSDLIAITINICHAHRLLAEITHRSLTYDPAAARSLLAALPAYLDRIREQLDKLPESI